MRKSKKKDSDFPYNQILTKETLDTGSWFDHECYWSKDILHQSESTINKDKKIIRARPVGIFPTKIQKETLMLWIGLLRKVYNAGVNYCRRNKPVTNANILRDLVRKSMSQKLKKRLKEARVNADCINETLRDVAKAYKTCFALKKAGHVKHFRVRYKKNTKPKQSFPLSKNTFGVTNGFCTGVLGELKTSEPVNSSINTKMCRLVYQNDRFVLWVPKEREKVTVTKRHQAVALDPGLRTFQTLYDGKNCMKIGNNSYHRLRKYISKINKTKGIASQKRIKRLHKRLFKKIANIVDDMHWKTAKFLVTHYKTIFIGKFSTKGVVSKKRNLAKICKQPIIHLKHFQFRMRLKEKAEEYGCNLICVNEAYTSQACGKCGTKNKKLGGAKVYHCSDPSCNFEYDRDFNGARNIMRKGYGIKICDVKKDK